MRPTQTAMARDMSMISNEFILSNFEVIDGFDQKVD